MRLEADELEALRLADLQGLYQAPAAREMGVSRATFGRIVASARKKVATALVQGRALLLPALSGQAQGEPLGRPRARRPSRKPTTGGGPVVQAKDETTTPRRVGVALDVHGNIARHFGHAAACRVYELGEGEPRVVEERTRPGDAGTGGRHAHSQRPPRHAPGDGRGQGRGNGPWIAEMFGGCQVVVTAGLGAGAKRNLQALGARVVVTDHPRDPDAAVALLARGKL